MDAIWIGLAVLCFLVLYLGLGVWVFSALLLVSITGLHVLLGQPIDRIAIIAKSIIWRSSNAWELSAIPIFIFMGEIAFRSNLPDRLFRGLAPIVDLIPGRLLHVNIIGCTLFAAVSGSSTATTATIGKLTTSALAERQYGWRLAVGSLAGAGSFGLLIPPSIMLIIYGVLAEVSIASLFIAGVIPGLFIATLYSVYIAGRCALDPSLSPTTGERHGFRARVAALRELAPIASLIVIVLGSIYTGLATPSEAAAIGLAAIIVMTAIGGELSWGVFRDALLETLKTSCMLATIMAAAAVLSTAMGYLHTPADLAAAIARMDLAPFTLIAVLAAFYVIMGMFLDGISLTVMSLPVTLPLAVQSGFDPIWFGVFLVIMVEIGLMTPPVGFNLFVLQGLTGRSLGSIARAATPFFLLMIFAATVITLFPQVVLWLPATIGGP
jgi:C4-dicarboxylate transporter, DctM subunit